MRHWTIIPNGPAGECGYSEPYTAWYDIKDYCRKHPEAGEADVERIAAFYKCHVRWEEEDTCIS